MRHETLEALAIGIALADQTLRMIAHLCIGCHGLRVRQHNAHGTRKLYFGGARLGMGNEAAGIVPGWARPLTFAACELGDDTAVIVEPRRLTRPLAYASGERAAEQAGFNLPDLRS